MRILRHQNYQTMPWKNGLGTTREIYCERQDDRMIWRLSLALVSADGPFSNFAGLERILTVVKGKGLRLVGEEKTYVARPFEPVHFSGGEKITGLCDSTPIEDFNLIYDPEAVAAEVRVTEHPAGLLADVPAGATVIVHVFSGEISLGSNAILKSEDTCILSDTNPEIEVSDGARCAVVTLIPR